MDLNCIEKAWDTFFFLDGFTLISLIQEDSYCKVKISEAYDNTSDFYLTVSQPMSSSLAYKLFERLRYELIFMTLQEDDIEI